ncbi:hypothetical protein MKW94_004019 [Papaver nudicaule]|uniref:Magnesium-dependent phosphatase 1 n=1 Tax=Papaver nudicaule TaxID=74823 RepID=A0AA41VHP2_PAPNU|nr:hypothetical protein [Papaver nudicaule]
MAEENKVKDEALQILGLFETLPRLVVFDLDYTLWPFYCECRSKREMPKLYPHVNGIISALKEKGIDMAIASRSPTADIAKTFLGKLEIQSMFVAHEIFSSWTHKTEHFQRIHRRTGVPFNSMLFFDDEDRNIDTVSKMGVTSVLVGNGVTLGAFREGLTNFSQNSGSSSRSKSK